MTYPVPPAVRAAEGARALLKASCAVMIAAVLVAALLPSQSDGAIAGPLGVTTAVIGGSAMIVAWVAALWHAGTLAPWKAAVPRWIVVVVLAFGTGVAAFFYYVLFAHWHRGSSRP